MKTLTLDSLLAVQSRPAVPAAKKIELIYCLQANADNGFNFFKGMYQSHLEYADEVILIAKNYITKNNVNMDLILTKVGISKALFVGHWNDGVI